MFLFLVIITLFQKINGDNWHIYPKIKKINGCNKFENNNLTINVFLALKNPYRQFYAKILIPLKIIKKHNFFQKKNHK